MKPFPTSSALIRLARASLPKFSRRTRLPWRAGVFLITCVFTWVEFSPATHAGIDAFKRLYRDAILEDNPIVYWRLGESVGPIAYDESANGRDALYVGHPSLGLNGAIEDPDTAAGFNGNNQYLYWDPSLDPRLSSCSGVFTVEAWVMQREFSLADVILNTSTDGARFGFNVRFDTFNLDLVQKEIRFDVGDGTRLLSTSRIPFDFQAHAWYYIAAVVTESGATFYVNGSAIGYTSYQGAPLLFDSLHKIVLGANPRSRQTSNRADNMIDEVAIYDYALSADQISAHFAVGNGIF